MGSLPEGLGKESSSLEQAPVRFYPGKIRGGHFQNFG
jgi:hypothetical protein